jgi:quercetin dioxygenase-like cupin family protein
MSDKNPYFIASGDVSQQPLAFGGMRRTMGTTDNMMLLEIFLPRETVVPMHQHVHDQIGYMIQGRYEMTVGDETFVLTPGDSYAVPGNVLHGGRVLTDTVLVEIFSPPREEFRNPPTD